MKLNKEEGLGFESWLREQGIVPYACYNNSSEWEIIAWYSIDDCSDAALDTEWYYFQYREYKKKQALQAKLV